MAIVFDEIQAAHLLRRAGFGGTRQEIADFVSMGREASVNYLVDFEIVDDSEMESGLAAANFLEPNQNNMLNVGQIQQWWMYRMLHTKRPLVEKMVLFWHDHFATAVSKVVNREYMIEQNYILREHALGNFEDLVLDVAQDPAMIVFLDNNTNIKGSPNENFGRELMELFTTGIFDQVTGEENYTEFDIQEAARAFTGWTIRRRNFFFNAAQHDFGIKTVFGESGDFNGEDIINMLVQLDATARHMAWKLLEWFVFPDPSAELIEEVAQVYFDSGYNIKEVVRYILLSDAFCSQSALNANVKNPTEFIVGMIRMLEADADPRAFLDSMALLEQVLFNPPTVAGWDWGLAWINTATLLIRYNVSNSLASARGRVGRSAVSFDPGNLLSTTDAASAEAVVDFFLALMGPLDVSVTTRQTLIDYLDSDGTFTVNNATIDQKVRGLVHLVTALPEFQLN
jgi:uncharacterized protein (DUF1800 family)